MDLKAARFETTDGVATFTMNRPKQLNPLTEDLRADFRWLVDHVSDDDAIKVLVLTSDGDVFSAGGDVKMMAVEQGPPSALRAQLMAVHDWLERLIDLEIPVIAAVDGPVYGAGFSLALTADFILATPRARFCCVFNRIGLIPDMAIIHALPRRIGLSRAKELMYSARSFMAEEAMELGLVLEIHDKDNLIPAAQALAARFEKASPEALALTKRLSNRTFEVEYRVMAELESAAQAVCVATEYHRDAVRRFIAKEPALYDWDAMDREQQDKG